MVNDSLKASYGRIHVIYSLVFRLIRLKWQVIAFFQEMKNYLWSGFIIMINVVFVHVFSSLQYYHNCRPITVGNCFALNVII